jgi:ankyrin repeat protein
MDATTSDTFLREATEGSFERAAEMLRAEPELARASFLTACVTGEIEEVKKHPELAAESNGPLNAEPILYTAYSQFLRRDPARAPAILEVAKFLLANGANPNAFHPYGEWKLTALYAASGRANNPALTKLLLEAGANPNDNESLYHSTEFGDPRCTRLLLEHGAKIDGTNAVHRQLDFEDIEGLKLFFEFGAKPDALLCGNGNPLLHHAIDRGRSRAILKHLADKGADLKARNSHGLTPYRLAALLGHKEAVQLLAERGAAEELTPEERFLAACAAGDAAEAARLATKVSPLGSIVLPELAWRNNQTGVTLLLKHGVPVGALGISGGTALHNACWMGNLPLVETILPYNPPLELKDRCYDATPLGWAIHGMQNSKTHDGKPLLPTADHRGVIRALIAGGGQPNAKDREALEKLGL